MESNSVGVVTRVQKSDDREAGARRFCSCPITVPVNDKYCPIINAQIVPAGNQSNSRILSYIVFINVGTQCSLQESGNK